MNVRELIDALEDYAGDYGDETEVRLAIQPRWAFEHDIEQVVAIGPKRGEAAAIYIGEGTQLTYLNDGAAVALGWAEERKGGAR
jgi:hypothetical protein